MGNLNKLTNMIKDIELVMTLDTTLYKYSWGGLVKEAKYDVPWLWVFDNVLTKKECKDIIKISNKYYSPSAVKVGKSIEQHEGRTSYNTRKKWVLDINKKDKTKLNKLNLITSLLTSSDIKQQEEISIVRYKEGQFYKNHYDSYPINGKVINNGGNRIWTSMYYLSDVDDGGGTYFYPPQLKITPKPGRLVIWKNILDGKLNKKSLHAGLPIVKGTKYIANVWVREKIHNIYEEFK